ncbi:MAG: AraC family transcriptional regulator [Eubacteriales bacterium]|nr:AraC family transcriptional regulator [Eubacteriales bacterium]
MMVSELAKILDAKPVVEGGDLDAEVTCGYSCDLLSWVLAHGKKGMAWTTVQTHMNVIAVAVLMEMACVILAEDNQLEEASLKKAQEEGLAVLVSSKTAYELCALMAQAGVSPSAE